MAPVAFPDLSKASKDLLSKDFPSGNVKLEVKTKTDNGVTFSVTGHQDSASGAVFAETKVKYNDFQKGLTLTEAITTSNFLSAQVELEHPSTKGIKFDVLASLSPATSQKSLLANVYYKHPNVHSRFNANLLKGPTFNADVVIGQDGVFVGGETGYDIEKGTVTKYNASVAYFHKDYTAAIHATSALSAFSASYYHRVNPDVEAAAKVSWDSKAATNAVAVEIGTKAYLDRDTFVKAKIDNNGKLGLGYTQLLRPGVKLSIGGAFDTAKLDQNAHKIGLAVVLEN
ncbi:hypothetical protein CONCODRAFT_59803 [Conidiobolus coronatus NRRL 28638]|uniref:Voltage-dependent ion-selective channel n=1 Tax=Conidiobolus coronatus (strain ATCC 28846 / CBS 209.66 / NRRL 28638) TaxID=796925 RepID=A0A137P237_CONC2|nr:hypothetical protein CONCODRAFT_59803 [Conidiobolus coronatus NRRL 28638]|eukprot:KXN68959.1 hypothetical protein CONCODRAFT_59803 [Conidiobolus coronatus NRRL 28638]